MAEVTPAFKEQIECACGRDDCPRWGTPMKSGHIRQCPDTCPSCRGRRNRGRGKRAEREMRRLAGVQVASNMHAAIGEEAWDSFFLDECKAGKQVNPYGTRFCAAEAQAEGNRAVGDSRPFRFLARPEGMPDGIVSVRGRVWQTVIQPALDDFYKGAPVSEPGRAEREQ